jgi:FAD/FMN-containing dehydrogenase
MHTSLLRDRLAHQVVGAVLDGDDPAAVAEAAGFNTAVTQRPSVVVAAQAPADVVAAVRFARETGRRVSVQATGHGASSAVEGAVLVTTSRLDDVRVDPVGRTARVGAGARWRSVIDASVPHGLAPLSGSSSGVGVVGYTLGGGMGHLARRCGFAADHVTAVELVTADGQARRVTALSDPELFWAVRGGQGRFGIATALEFGLVPVPEFFGGAMVFGPADVERVLRAFAGWAPTLPEEVTTSVAVLRLPPVGSVPPPLRGVVSLALRFGFTGPAARGDELVGPMRRVADPLLDSIGPMSYAAVDGIHMDPTEPMPAVMRGGLLHSLPTDAVDALLAVAGPHVDVPLVMAELRLMGGALGRPADVPNAVAGREGAFSVAVVAPAPPPLVETAHAVTEGVLRALEPWSPGISLVNFGGYGGVAGAAGAWSPEALDRLRRVKAAVDPDNVFGGALEPTTVAAGAR